MSLNIVIIDYDIGNVRSISNAFEKVGVTPVLSRDKDIIMSADGVVLPGVGAFAHAMENINKYSLLNIIKEYVSLNKPFMGICLGMQMLFDYSEEFGKSIGLELIEGKVIKLPVKNVNYEKLPHVSWNEINIKSQDGVSTILDNIDNKSDMYFVHGSKRFEKCLNILFTCQDNTL